MDTALAAKITDYRRIIAFRNILIHGYANVDARLVWDLLNSKLPVLSREISEVLADKNS